MSSSSPPPDDKGPQLFHHKPSKAHLKKAKSSPLNPSPSPKVMDPPSSSSSSAPPPPPPSVAPKKSFVRRMLPFLLAINFAVGAYVLTKTYAKKEVAGEEEVMEEAPAVPVKSMTTAVPEKVSVVQPTKPVQEPVKVFPPIPDDEQRHLFKWILEEKRKVKTKDSTEKKKIDEEKALLKHYIRAKSFPTLLQCSYWSPAGYVGRILSSPADEKLNAHLK